MGKPYRVHLHVVVTADDNAATVFPPGTDASTISKLVNDLNILFSHAEVQFNFDQSKDLDETYSTVLNNDYMVGAMERNRLAGRYSDKITLLFRDGNYQVGSNFSSGSAYYVVLHKSTMLNARKLVHELGHYFHLMHTHYNEPTKEQVEEEIRVYVEDEGHPIEDGLIALEVLHDNDRINVADTPFDLGTKGLYKIPCGKDVNLKFQVKFKNGKTKHPYVEKWEYLYIPNRSNPMSYFESCNFPHSFSLGQITVIHKGLVMGNRIRLLKGSAWNSANQQDFVSPATVSRHPDTVAVFASNYEGEMMTKVWDASRGSYWPSNTGWFSLGGTGIISPVVVSRRPDSLDLAARCKGGGGAIRSKVWSESTSEYYPSNTEWLDLNGSGWIDSGPVALSRAPDVLDLFVRWIDGTVRRKVWTEDSQQWSKEWDNLGGTGVGTSAAVARRPDIIDLYTRWNDGSIRSKVWRASDDSWWPGKIEWFPLGGRGYDSPAAVARRPDKIDLFVRWDDGTIRSKVWDDSRGSYWPGDMEWFNLGGQAASKPVAVCRNEASIALFTRWVDGSVRIKVWDDSRNSWWPSNTAWSNLGGDTVGAPAAVARKENRVVLYARWSDNTIRSKVWNGETSQWWPGQTEWLLLGQP